MALQPAFRSAVQNALVQTPGALAPPRPHNQFVAPAGNLPPILRYGNIVPGVPQRTQFTGGNVPTTLNLAHPEQTFTAPNFGNQVRFPGALTPPPVGPVTIPQGNVTGIGGLAGGGIAPAPPTGPAPISPGSQALANTIAGFLTANPPPPGAIQNVKTTAATQLPPPPTTSAGILSALAQAGLRLNPSATGGGLRYGV